MALRRKQVWLFLLCTAVLLSAGYGWGYASAYTGFYSASSLMDREVLDLEFNSRLLHFANSNQPERVRARLLDRVSEQVRYVNQIIGSSDDPAVVRNAAASLEQAREALAPPRNLGAVAAAAGAPVPGAPPGPSR
jgi:hypothetical protein